MIEVKSGSFVGMRQAGGTHVISRLVVSRRSDSADRVEVVVERIARRGRQPTTNPDVKLGSMSRLGLAHLIDDLKAVLEKL